MKSVSVGSCTFLVIHKSGDLNGVAALSDIEIARALTMVEDVQYQAAADKYALLAQFARRGLNMKAGHSTDAAVVVSTQDRQMLRDTRYWEVLDLPVGAG